MKGILIQKYFLTNIFTCRCLYGLHELRGLEYHIHLPGCRRLLGPELLLIFPRLGTDGGLGLIMTCWAGGEVVEVAVLISEEGEVVIQARVHTGHSGTNFLIRGIRRSCAAGDGEAVL